jgi:hypothetical protein
MMNVGTLIAALQQLDPDLQVVIAQSEVPGTVEFSFELSTEWHEGVLALVPLGPTAPLA